MTGAGELSRRLVLQAPVESDDGQGGTIRSYADADVIWALVEPIGARGILTANALKSMTAYRITIRSGPELSLQHRLRDGAQIFTINAMRMLDRERFTEISAELVTD